MAPPVPGASPSVTPGVKPAPAPEPTPPPPKTIEELTKGYDKTEGIFTIYRKLERNEQRIFAEVKSSQIGPLYLLQSTFASGNAARITAGHPASDLVWRFEKTPTDRLVLSTPNLWYRSSDPNLKKAVERDFPDAFLAGFNVLARSDARKSVLIDFSSLFDGGLSGLSTALASDSYGIDPSLSFTENVKNFPTNLVVDVRYNFRRLGPPSPLGGNTAQADPRSLPLRVTYNLYALPENGVAAGIAPATPATSATPAVVTTPAPPVSPVITGAPGTPANVTLAPTTIPIPVPATPPPTKPANTGAVAAPPPAPTATPTATPKTNSTTENSAQNSASNNGLISKDYRPRLADPRVGFFVNGQLSAGRTGFETFDDDAAADPRVVYINRWNLQKKNPAAKISEPIKAITFYLDTSIPLLYRGAVREGILSWNRAFEPLGFKGAIVVKDAPVNDWDTADMRFNTIRWVASPPSGTGAYAVALLRENPLTGEIINAGINVNSNFVRVAYQEKQEVINPLDDVRKAQTPFAESRIGESEIGHAFHGEACELDGEWLRNASLAREAAQVAGFPLDNKKYVNQLLRGVVAHEFGHILGLRHNFVASTFLTPAQLKNSVVTKNEGVSASVMDYVGFNAFGLKSGAALFSSGPGRYDKWAISYGYTPIDATSTQGEKPALKRIAARTNEPGLAYQSDELADDYDPTIVRYDLSSDPLAYVERSFDETRELLRTLGARKPKVGETYASFTRRLRSLIRVNGRDASIAARYIGGAINRRVVRGDRGEKIPFSPVPLAQQRRALEILNRRIFAPGAFVIPAAYLRQTAADPYDFSDAAADAAFPIREDISRVRSGVLFTIFDPVRLTRIANTSWKFPAQTLGFPELFATVRRGVWGTLGAKSQFSAQQRDLARAHLRILTDISVEKRPAPADAKLVAFSELQTLKKQLSGPRETSPDALTRLFFADTLRRINAALIKKPE